MICSGDGFAGHVNCHGACVGASASMGGPHHTGRRRCKSVSLMSKHQVENHKWFQSMLHRDMHWKISTPSQSHHLISPHLSLITRASIKTNFATPVSVRRAASHHCCCGKLRIPHTHAHTDGVVVVGTHAHVGWANAPCSKTHMRIHSHVNCTRSHKTLSCQDHDSTTLIDCHHNFSNR